MINKPETNNFVNSLESSLSIMQWCKEAMFQKTQVLLKDPDFLQKTAAICNFLEKPSVQHNLLMISAQQRCEIFDQLLLAFKVFKSNLEGRLTHDDAVFIQSLKPCVTDLESLLKVIESNLDLMTKPVVRVEVEVSFLEEEAIKTMVIVRKFLMLLGTVIAVSGSAFTLETCQDMYHDSEGTSEPASLNSALQGRNY